MLLRLIAFALGITVGDRMAALIMYRVRVRRDQAARKARMLLTIAEGWAA